MSDPRPDDHGDRLRQLDKRIRKLKGEDAPPSTESHMGSAELAWRMVIELVAGIGIGFGIGYGLDALFGTKPVLMIVFIFLGFAAGIRVMMGSAREVQEKQAAQGAAEDEDGTHGGQR